jgi:branched-chain amino acid transport system ATP-binding protein
MEGHDILTLEHVAHNFSGLKVLEDVSITIRQGERHALIGPNGAGKTTVFNCITGNLRPTSGKITYNGGNIVGQKPFQIVRAGIARSFQITNIFKNLTVRENLQSAILSRLQRRYNFWRWISQMADVENEVEEMLIMLRLNQEANTPAGLLSYGQQRALEIGLTVALKPEVVLLDEPTAGMTKDETRNAIELIRSLTKGVSMMIIEHDMDVIFTLADRITVLQYGQVICTDIPTAVHSNTRVREAYLGEDEEV